MYIVYIYPEITIKGGADRVIVEKANYLAAHGYRVSIVTESQLGREPSFPLHPSVRLIDIGLDFNQQYSQRSWKRVFLYFSLMAQYKHQLRKVLQAERPDVVISAMGRSIGIVNDMDDGSVKIAEVHSVKANVRSLNQLEQKGLLFRWVAWFMRRRIGRMVARLSALVLLSQRDADDWTEARRTVVIPNSVPFVPPTVSRLENKQAIMVARYNDAKGYNYMVEAWSLVHQRHPDWVLNVYGSGELHDDVIRWIDEHGLTDTMILHEPTDQIMERYMESSMCVMSSRYEAFPMVLLEAMVCGVPSVAFDCPHGPRQIIRDGEDGLLVEYLNPQALADGICRLIEDEAFRRQLGTKARENVMRFSQSSVMQQWETLFHQLIEERRP